MPVHANSGSSNPGCDRRFPTHARNPGSRVAAMAPLPGSLRTFRRSQLMTPLRTDLP
ncbi:hypothetical protein [Acinetobacter baumannii]